MPSLYLFHKLVIKQGKNRKLAEGQKGLIEWYKKFPSFPLPSISND